MRLSIAFYSSRIHLNKLLKTSSVVSNYRHAPLLREVHRKSIYKTEEAKKFRFFVIDKYIEYLKNYDKVLQKSFTGAMEVYKVFVDGCKEFIADVKDYIQIVRILNTSGYIKLTRKEIELYDQMPKDMRRVAPVLLISALPFANYVIFPLAYMFPRHLLSSHFWTLQQKTDFNIVILRNRLRHNRPVFRHLQLQLDNLKCHALHDLWREVLGMVGSGVQPTTQQILHCKELFSQEPYHLLYLSGNHAKHLLKMHDMHIGWFRRTRLAQKAKIIIEMDKAIMREGGVHNLPLDSLKRACFIRGLNPIGMRNEDMVRWLTNWIQVSSTINKDNYSLLLHCPVLLGYNEPSNWRLIYPFK